MTWLLALDTSSEACSVTLSSGHNHFEQLTCQARSHAHDLLPFIERVLVDAGIRLGDLAGIACVQGPGSFTGLRIGVSVVQGLAYGADIPVIGISSLQAMAQSAVTVNPIKVCAIDARMSELYWACYTSGDTPVCVLPPCLSPIEGWTQQLIALLQVHNIQAWSWVMDNPDAFAYLDSDLGLEWVKPQQPLSKAVMQLARPLFEQGQFHSPEQLEPIYLRNSVSWTKRRRIRVPESK